MNASEMPARTGDANHWLWAALPWPQPFILRNQKVDVAADQIAKQACLVLLYSDARLEVGSMANAAASGRG
jgi:hypothetical protein